MTRGKKVGDEDHALAAAVQLDGLNIRIVPWNTLDADARKNFRISGYRHPLAGLLNWEEVLRKIACPVAFGWMSSMIQLTGLHYILRVRK